MIFLSNYTRINTRIFDKFWNKILGGFGYLFLASLFSSSCKLPGCIEKICPLIPAYDPVQIHSLHLGQAEISGMGMMIMRVLNIVDWLEVWLNNYQRWARVPVDLRSRVPVFLEFSFAFRVPALLYDIVFAFPGALAFLFHVRFLFFCSSPIRF